MHETVPKGERHTRTFSEPVRRMAAMRLSSLMREVRPFSFVRVGDMELGLLLAEQNGHRIGWSESNFNELNSCATTWGHPGIDMELVPRLRAAYEGATYVDFGERIWMNRALVPLLKLRRPDGSLRNFGEDDSHVFMDWFRYEFKKYCEGRRILFVGSEAGLLRELFSMPEYRVLAADYLSGNSEYFFQEESATSSSALEGIKMRIIRSISEYRIDTLFICLGGAAKILCKEISEENKICAFDAGSAMRALSFAASEGQSGVLTTHHPFLIHVPFGVHMDAVQLAWPKMSIVRLLVKAQCQVLRELCEQNVGESSAMLECMSSASVARLTFFEHALKEYYTRYRALEVVNTDTQRISSEFRKVLFRLKHSQKWWWIQGSKLTTIHSRIAARFRSI